MTLCVTAGECVSAEETGCLLPGSPSPPECYAQDSNVTVAATQCVYPEPAELEGGPGRDLEAADTAADADTPANSDAWLDELEEGCRDSDGQLYLRPRWLPRRLALAIGGGAEGCLDQLAAQALGIDPVLRELCQDWALASRGGFLLDAGANPCGHPKNNRQLTAS
jgi:hypothetical protein